MKRSILILLFALFAITGYSQNYKVNDSVIAKELCAFHKEYKKGLKVGITGTSLIILSGLINTKHNALDNSIYYLAAGKIYSKPFNYAFNSVCFSTGLLLNIIGIVIRIDSHKNLK